MIKKIKEFYLYMFLAISIMGGFYYALGELGIILWTEEHPLIGVPIWLMIGLGAGHTSNKLLER